MTNKALEQASQFAKYMHKDQKRVDGAPYFSHCFNVYNIVSSLKSSSFDKQSAQIMALLHDTMEDTEASFSDITKLFGHKIANGVMALTKNKQLPSNERMKDSLERIKKDSIEACIVKMADRLDNISKLNPKWNKQKAVNYAKEADLIAEQLGVYCNELKEKLIDQIKIYKEQILKHEIKGGYMIYLKPDDGYLFAYSEDSGLTYVYKNDNWKISDINYTSLINEDSVHQLTFNEAMSLTNNKSPLEVEKKIENTLTQE